MKFAGIFIADPHLRMTPPPSRNTYREDFEVKWGEICSLAVEFNADMICFLGDIFHPLLSGSVSHGMVSWSINQFRRAPCPVYTILGGHDVRIDKDMDHLMRRPLGVLVSSSTMKLIDETGITVNGVHIAGSTAPMGIDANVDNYLMTYSGSEVGIMLTHGNLVFPGHRAWGDDVTSVEFLDTHRPIQKIHINGHLHTQQAVYQGKSGTRYLNPGAVMRSFDMVGVADIPKVAMVQVVDGEIRAGLRTLKCIKPSGEVFKVEEIQRKKAQGVDAGKFVEMLAVESKRLSLEEDLVGEISKMGLEPTLFSTVKHYLELVSVG